MLIYARQFFKIRVVFHTLYLGNEVRDPIFFFISETLYSLSVGSKSLSTEHFRANVLKSTLPSCKFSGFMWCRARLSSAYH